MNIRSIHKQNLGRRFIASVLCFVFLSTSVAPAYAQSVLSLPAPGMRIGLTPEFRPLLLKAVKVHKDNPFQFDFIVDVGDSGLIGEGLKNESDRLIKYFLASLTTPENDLWVNLSPYEKDKIIPDTFGTTEMGRDLLSQDYILKQLTASLVFPEEGLGKEFWNKVYAEAQAKFGTTDVPVDTFNKVWIVPEKAVVYENGVSAYVGETKLKVMLEQDYIALTQSKGTPVHPDARTPLPGDRDVNALGSQIVREIIIPALEKEVNTGKNFARLRQVYHSLVLANWYKKRLKDSILAKIYLDKGKVKGVDIEDKAETQKIYERYIEAFKKGVYNYIREDVDPATQEVIPRKYFSGGFALSAVGQVSEFRPSSDVPATIGTVTYELGVDTTPSQLKNESTVELPEAKMLDVADQARSNPGSVAAVQVTAMREELKAIADFIEKDIRYYSRKAKDVSSQRARLERIKFTIANLVVLEGLHAIAAILPGLEKDENGEYKFFEYARERAGIVQFELNETAGVIRLEKDKDGNDVLVIIHKVFERFNHAGRDRNAVYASSEAKVQHELAELAMIKQFALDNGMDISEGLGKGIRAWANNKNEDRLARQNELRQLDYDAHQAGLKAEADYEGRSYEVKIEKIKPATEIVANFDWTIAGKNKASVDAGAVKPRAYKGNKFEINDFGFMVKGKIFDPEFIERERSYAARGIKTIVFDMDATLVTYDGTRSVLRPWIEKQLDHLKRSGFRLVIWTASGRRKAELMYADIPAMKDYFDLVIAAENFTSSAEITTLDDIKTAYSSYTPEQQKILHGLGGIKDITLLKYAVLVDDFDASAGGIIAERKLENLKKHPESEKMNIYVMKPFYYEGDEYYENDDDEIPVFKPTRIVDDEADKDHFADRIIALAGKQSESVLSMSGAGTDNLDFTRNEHETKRNVPVRAVLEEIYREQQTALGKDVKIIDNDIQRSRQEGADLEVAPTRIEPEGTKVFIDSRFAGIEHAGRDRNAVYASSEARAQHELAELAMIRQFALDNGIDISEGLGKGIRAWANNKNEDRLARQNQLRQLDYDAHQAGLKAEADFEGRSYEIEVKKIQPATKFVENFDWTITGDNDSSGEETNDISDQIQVLEGSRALSSYDIEQFTTLYPEWNWQKAAEVPWREVIHDPMEQPKPVNQNQINLWRNQIEVRRLFLQAFKSLLDGQFKDEEFGAVLTEMNVALNLGATRSSYYFSTTIGVAFESIEELKQASGKPRIADFKSRAAAISKRLRSMILSKGSIPFDDVLLDLAAFYRFYMGRYLFEAGNNSLSMNMINGLLRLQGSNGIPHHHLDTKYKEYFFGQMRDSRFLNEFVEHVNESNEEIQRDGADAGAGARSFEPSTAMWDFFQSHGEFTQGWWIAFDVDKAGDVETGFPDDVKTRDRILEIGRSLAALNKNIIETFAKHGGRFFGTQQQNRSPDKEEGYIYISENLSQKDLKQMLDSIRKDYAGSIAKTVTFAVMNADDIAQPPEGDLEPARFFLTDVEVKLEMLLRKLKGPGFNDDPKPEGYGDKVGFYSSSGESGATNVVMPGGIDLKVRELDRLGTNGAQVQSTPKRSKTRAIKDLYLWGAQNQGQAIGQSEKELADSYGVSLARVRKVLEQYGITPLKTAGISEELSGAGGNELGEDQQPKSSSMSQDPVFLKDFERNRTVDSLIQSVLYLESLLRKGPQYENRWGMRRMIVQALGALYGKMISQRQDVSLDFLESSLRDGSSDYEINADVREVTADVLKKLSSGVVEQSLEGDKLIEESLGILYPTRTTEDIERLFARLVDAGWQSSSKDQMVYRYLKTNKLDLLLSNRYVLDGFFSMSDQEWGFIENNLTQLRRLFNEGKNDEASQKYMQLAMLLEVIMPVKGTGYISELLQNNGGKKSVVRFLESKSAFLTNDSAWYAMEALIKRAKDEYAKTSRKAYHLDITTLFRILNISAALIDLDGPEILDEALEKVDVSNSLTDISRQLEEAFLAQLAKFFNVQADTVSLDINSKLYLPYLSKIEDAIKYLKKEKPWKIGRFNALIRAMLEDRYWDFIENEQQSDEEGVRIARHNAAVRRSLAEKGIRVDRWIGKEENRMLDEQFEIGGRQFSVRPISRNLGHDLFLGDFTNCSVGMSSNLYPDGMMERLTDEGLTTIEVVDESTQKTMAVAWLYIAEDGSAVIQNLEINANYEENPLMDSIGEKMVAYSEKFAVFVGAKRLLMGNARYGKYFENGFIEQRYGNNRVTFGQEKIGGYLGEKYYLRSAGEEQAFLITEFSVAAGETKGGIDLTSDKFDLNIRSNGNSAEVNFNLSQWENIQIEGLTPNIITITPITDIPLFLSGDERSDNQLALANR